MIPRFYNTDAYTEHYLGIRWPLAVWTAVLKQAVDDILVGPPAHEVRGLSLREAEKLAFEFRAAAEHWVEDEANEPRRFVWVCEQIGLDPSAVRRSIAERRDPFNQRRKYEIATR